MKVLGIEMAPKPGFIGTSSFGDTRLWRITHGQKIKNQMMKDALILWNQIEKESGYQLIVQTPVLTIGSDNKYVLFYLISDLKLFCVL
jgi:hypothetical protein